MNVEEKSINNLAEAFYALADGWKVLVENEFKVEAYQIVNGVLKINGVDGVISSTSFKFPTVAWRHHMDMVTNNFEIGLKASLYEV